MFFIFHMSFNVTGFNNYVVFNHSHNFRDINVQAQFSVNQSRPEEITMREDLGQITLMGDDGFGEYLMFIVA